MKVPFSWLKEYVDIDVTAQELEEKLFSCGFEVEELIPPPLPASMKPSWGRVYNAYFPSTNSG